MTIATDKDYENYFEVSDATHQEIKERNYRQEVITSLCDDLPSSSLSNEEIRNLLAGLSSSADEKTTEEKSHKAINRWKRGHQVFDLLLDGINQCLARLKSRDLITEQNEVAEGLRSTARMFRASTIAFNYASDFSSAAYTEVVRPSMQPPNQPEGFSGQLNAKHREFKKNFGDIEILLEKIYGTDTNLWAREVREAWYELLTAKTENQRQHGRVCQKFVPNGQSLLREYLKKTKEITDKQGGLRE